MIKYTYREMNVKTISVKMFISILSFLEQDKYSSRFNTLKAQRVIWAMKLKADLSEISDDPVLTMMQVNNIVDQMLFEI